LPTPEKLAHSVLASHWDTDRSGYWDLPVDPILIARRLEIRVLTSDMEQSGMLGMQPPADPEIYVRASDHYHRQRFYCAHELGRYLRRVERGDLGESYAVDFTATLFGHGSDPEDEYAHQFALCLLMPEDELHFYWDFLGCTLVALAGKFRVPVETAGLRLRGLGFQV
jgi:Zn-dependent peptidase ImmA (M78 family)